MPRLRGALPGKVALASSLPRAPRMSRRHLALLAALIVGCPRPSAAEEIPRPPRSLTPPRLLDPVEPSYPAGAQPATPVDVVLELRIDREGRVEDAKVTTSGGEAFDASALEAAGRLRFDPARREGEPIFARIRYTFHFETASPPPPPPPASLLVNVRRGDRPLPNAEVVVTSGGSSRSARTGPDGAVRFPGLEAGAVTIAVTADGYQPITTTDSLVAGEELAATVRPVERPVAGEIVVRGERPAREVTRYTLAQEEVRRAPGTNGDALRVLENLPGVARPPPMMGALLVRGAGPEDTGVFVDGTQVPLVFHFGGITSVVPAEALERLDFAPGNFGPEYGRALGGIVEIGLKSPRRDRIGGLGQLDLLDGRLFVEGPITSKLRFLIGARRSWVDAWLGPVLSQTGNGVKTAPVYYDGQALLEWDLHSTTTGRLAFFGSSDEFRLILSAPDSADPVIGNLGIKTQFWRLQARTESRLLDDRLRLVNVLSYGQEIRDIQVGGASIRINDRPLVFRTELRGRIIPSLRAALGLDINFDLADVSVRAPPQDSATDAPAPSFSRPPAVVDQAGTATYRPAVYALLEYRPRPSILLLPSFRADYTREGRAWSLQPRLAARWDARSGDYRTALKGGVGLYAQPPQPFEAIPPFGTPGLRNNRVLQTSLGIEQGLYRGLEASIEGFYKRLDDLVVQRASAGGASASGVTYGNSGSGTIYGLEVYLRYRSQRVNASLAYTLSRSLRRSAPDVPERLFEYDQTHVLSVVGSWSIGRGWEVGGRFRLSSGNPVTPLVGGVGDLDAGAYAAVAGAPFSARLDYFHQLDLRVEKRWSWRLFAMALYLDIQNVYSRQAPQALQYNYNYTQSTVMGGLPILPILGLRGER